jgi:catechol 2,3-dioxygenase-like lactoylglutathione lyase family enzyme
MRGFKVATAQFAALCIAATVFGQDATPRARWHHVHINATDPGASIDFYTSKFDCEKGRYQDRADAVWAQKSWLLFEKVRRAPPSEIVSPIWHIGWGAEDMKAAYDKQVASGTKFETPITDISELAGRAAGGFFYAYVDGPDHELIELNTASHHHFGHLHLLSSDPVAAGEWYSKQLGIPQRGKQTEKRVYRGFAVGPAAFLQADNVSIIIYPVEYARTQWPKIWKTRKDFEPTRGRVIDHVAFSVDDLGSALELLRSQGVKVTSKPREILGVKSAMIEGPDHISIELVEGHAKKQ